MWKRRYYNISYEGWDGEDKKGGAPSNPEEDITNPLMFYVSMGNYPVTVTQNRFFSGYGKQAGGSYLVMGGTDSDGQKLRNERVIIPTYDDTPYVTDIARWELSKICDEKKQVTLELTIDSVCLYNIQLKNRLSSALWEGNFNIHSMEYDIPNFKVRITLENNRAYSRSVSLQKKTVSNSGPGQFK